MEKRKFVSAFILVFLLGAAPLTVHAMRVTEEDATASAAASRATPKNVFLKPSDQELQDLCVQLAPWRGPIEDALRDRVYYLTAQVCGGSLGTCSRDLKRYKRIRKADTAQKKMDDAHGSI